MRNDYIWYQGFMDTFLCFELLEASNDPIWNSDSSIPMNDLSTFINFFKGNLIYSELPLACIYWIIEKIEIYNKRIGPNYEVGSTSIYCIDNEFIKRTDKDTWTTKNTGMIIQKYFQNRAYILIHTNVSSIENHLSIALWKWRKWEYFTWEHFNINKFTSKKQEELVIESIEKFRKEWIDLKNLIFNIEDFLKDLWIYNLRKLDDWEEPNLPINPFLALWSLQDRWILTITFWWTTLIRDTEPIYRLTINEDNWINSVNKASTIKVWDEIVFNTDTMDKKVTIELSYDKQLWCIWINWRKRDLQWKQPDSIITFLRLLNWNIKESILIEDIAEENDTIFDSLSENKRKKESKKYYNSFNHFNKTIVLEFWIQKFFIISTNAIKLNPDYIFIIDSYPS